MNAPLSRYLTRFSCKDEGELAALDAAAAETMVTLGLAELEARIEQARRSVSDAAAAALAQERVTLRQERETAVAEALAAARADWCAAAADQLASQAEAAFLALHETLSSEIAMALRPVLADALRERATALLGAAIERLLQDPSQPAITLKGPTDLVAALRAKYAQGGIEFVETDATEATITAAGTFIETRLTAALADLTATGI